MFYYQNEIRLGSGDEVIFSKIGQDPSIVTHESMHFLIDHIAGLGFEAEAGSLNEGIADFLTCVSLGNPLLAENAFINGPYKRRIDIVRRWDEQTGGLYFDSGIYSSLFWELKETLGVKKILGVLSPVLYQLNQGTNFTQFNKLLLAESIKSFSKPDLETFKAVLKKRGFNIKGSM